MPDKLEENYSDLLDCNYDCVDRIVLRGYCRSLQYGGGFRAWWRRLYGSDKNLDDTHLMRFAGHFARRIHAYAKAKKIPIIECHRDDKKFKIARRYFPKEDKSYGVFCILVGRAPGRVYQVKICKTGAPHLEWRNPQPLVNHYHFHIMDPKWGHIIITLCPHPPFQVRIVLNGHEWVSNQAKKKKLCVEKEENCFTQISNAPSFAKVADTLSSTNSIGHLYEVCERWVYSACLCFALQMSEQKKTDFHYDYSVYQIEYSRNYVFYRGRVMDEVFNSMIDRIRSPLNIRTIKTIFGSKRRPFNKKTQRKHKEAKVECVIERPMYDLTVLKIHFGKLTAKIYTKGEHVLRIETMAFNCDELRCGRSLGRFDRMVVTLKEILERFVSVLQGMNVCFLSETMLETWHLPTQIKNTKVGGINVNSLRIKAVMETLLTLSIKPSGFFLLDVASQVREILKSSNSAYTTRQAAYDLRKFRAKNIVCPIANSRRYEISADGLKELSAYFILKDKVLRPLISGAKKYDALCGKILNADSNIDIHYKNTLSAMKNLFSAIGIAA